MPTVPPEFRSTFERYLEGPRRVREAVLGVDARALNERPPGGDWSIRDVLLHLVDAELVRSVRLRRIIAEEEPELEPFDQELWQRRLQYLWRDPELALALLDLLVRTNAELVHQSGRDGWRRSGQHAERGRVTVADLLEAGARHFEEHVAQIAATRARVRGARAPLL